MAAGGSGQLRAEFAPMEQGTSDLNTQAGVVEQYRSELKAECMRVMGNFAGGMGSDQHQAAMAIVDQMCDEMAQSTIQQGTGLSNATEDFRTAGQKMTSVLGSGG